MLGTVTVHIIFLGDKREGGGWVVVLMVNYNIFDNQKNMYINKIELWFDLIRSMIFNALDHVRETPSYFITG